METQQNSDITYCVYDYDRLSGEPPRQLHIQQSIDVVSVPAKAAQDSVKPTNNLPANCLNELYFCHYYRVFKLVVDGRAVLEQSCPFMNILGKVEMTGKMEVIASTVQPLIAVVK